MSRNPEAEALRRRGGRRWLTALLFAASATLSAGALEWALRTWPDLLPSSYRVTWPLRGIELLHPGVLARTPIEGVPLPYRFGAGDDFRGGPPAALQTMGVVPRSRNPDLFRYPEIRFHYDAWGLPNPEDRSRADVVLVGDSFTRALGSLAPRGLQPRLEQELGLVLFNLGISGLGPQREAWLLRKLGLPSRPKAVVWFFFAGNDLEDAAAVARLQAKGVSTYADLFSDFEPPKSLLVDLVRHWLRPRPESPGPVAPLPPFILSSPEIDREIWFNPTYLRHLTRSRATLEAHPGWGIVTTVLARVAAELRERSVDFLVVYIPTKPEAYFPAVRSQADLIWRTVRSDPGGPGFKSAEPFRRALRARRRTLEGMLATFCEEERIDFLDLGPGLEALAARGELGYFAADTHWNEVGQGVALGPLRDWLVAIGLAPGASLRSNDSGPASVSRFSLRRRSEG